MRPAFVLFAALLAASSAHAQTPASSTAAAVLVEAGSRVLDTAVVRMPGPGMWKVHKGANTLWILGTVSPLPAGMVWNSARMRSVVASAAEVIGEPSVSVG